MKIMHSFDTSSSSLPTFLDNTIDRRSLLRKMASAGLVAAAGGAGLSLARGFERATAGAQFYSTTSSLNLRTGPGPRRKVLLVIPNGAGVESLGKSKNGYMWVRYNYVEGWAHGDYLTPADDISVPTITGKATTNDSVNFRNQPSYSASVMRVLPAGTTVDAFDVWQDGFRMVGYAQVQGWVFDDYLDEGGSGGELGDIMVATTAVNLRSAHNTTSRVLLVIPQGATVYPQGANANNFICVTYKGNTGWVHQDFLKTAARS